MRALPHLSWSRVVILGAMLVVGYLLFNAAKDTILSQQLNDEEQQIHQEIEDLRRQEKELLAIRDYLQTDEFIEGVARHVLGLVRPGESLIVVTSSVPPTPTPPNAAEDDARRWWEDLYGQ
jgi:cell division protein FtsB